jgi:NADH:ubiquinone oxidoreductase subunit E
MSKPKTVFICINKRGGRACIGPDSRAVFRALHKRARDRAAQGGAEIKVERMTCLGYCSDGPNVKILGGRVFNEVTLDDVEAILDAAEATKRP